MIERLRRLIIPLTLGGIGSITALQGIGFEPFSAAKDSVPTIGDGGIVIGGSRGWFGRTGSGFGFGK
ncbi:MAG TPA: hypothetical protein DCQ98_04665 [Planctomycetaceae bacterium]|nr:hypothetical protein [Planctomycetaceae bacterium]HRF02136.1 hypothetical protein [Pirellulaceae bacterium]